MGLRDPGARLPVCGIPFILQSLVFTVGTWRSLVAHLLWEQRVAGSNPVVPTIFSFLFFGTQFLGPPDWNTGEERDHRGKNPSPADLII